jgi:hypothetical protein
MIPVFPSHTPHILPLTCIFSHSPQLTCQHSTSLCNWAIMIKGPISFWPVFSHSYTHSFSIPSFSFYFIVRKCTFRPWIW